MVLWLIAKDGEDLFQGQEGSFNGGSDPTAPIEAGEEYDGNVALRHRP
jgi:hypothetical protein